MPCAAVKRLPFFVLLVSAIVQTGVSPRRLQAQSGDNLQFAYFATSRLDAAPQVPDTSVSSALPVPAIRTSASGAGLVIQATFNANVDSATQTVINNAIAFYESTFTNPITVNIEFYEMSSGLGMSSLPIYTVPYSTYRTALMNNGASADDATAFATLPAGSGNPINGGSIELTSANGRAIGLNTPEVAFGSNCQNFTGSGCIGLNVTLANAHGDLLSVVEHEMDEVLGLGSALGFSTTPAPQDLFRWASSGTRSFARNPSQAVPCVAPSAFFSIDGGNTNLNAFNNCDNGGDYGDWITHTPSQVQDAFTNFSGTPFLSATSTEVRALDVIGYTIVATPKKRRSQITSN
jgi:hypothetical protein